MKDRDQHLETLRRYLKDRKNVSRQEVLEAIIFFRNKEKPDFIPEEIWKVMLSWG